MLAKRNAASLIEMKNQRRIAHSSHCAITRIALTVILILIPKLNPILAAGCAQGVPLSWLRSFISAARAMFTIDFVGSLLPC